MSGPADLVETVKRALEPLVGVGREGAALEADLTDLATAAIGAVQSHAFVEAEQFTFAVLHNPNCPSPYMVRLPRTVLFQTKGEFADRVGYGQTFGEAFADALAEARRGTQ